MTKKIFFKAKKAISMDFLVTIIVVLIAFVLLSFVLTRFMGDFDEKQAEAICRDSIALRGSTAVSIGGDDSKTIKAALKPIPVSCRTIDLDIEGGREEIKGKIVENR